MFSSKLDWMMGFKGEMTEVLIRFYNISIIYIHTIVIDIIVGQVMSSIQSYRDCYKIRID